MNWYQIAFYFCSPWNRSGTWGYCCAQIPLLQPVPQLPPASPSGIVHCHWLQPRDLWHNSALKPLIYSWILRPVFVVLFVHFFYMFYILLDFASYVVLCWVISRLVLAGGHSSFLSNSFPASVTTLWLYYMEIAERPKGLFIKSTEPHQLHRKKLYFSQGKLSESKELTSSKLLAQLY